MLYKTALLTDRTNKRDFINNWFDATAFTLSPFDILSGLFSVLYGFSLFILYRRFIRVCLTDRHEFVIRAQTPNRPSQMPFPKCKHTHTWACTANKCDETQIYWHVVVRASRYGLCERVATEFCLILIPLLFSVLCRLFQNSDYSPPSLVFFNYFMSICCSFLPCVSSSPISLLLFSYLMNFWLRFDSSSKFFCP